MAVGGIIAEYNPLHTGHLYHLRETANRCPDGVVVVLSGNAVQRAGPAAFDKFLRAEMAVKSGADLVLELPAIWSCASAERFAYGGVSILAATGIVDTLSFGSESGETDGLFAAAEAVDALSHADLQPYLLAGMTYAAAREAALRERFGDTAADLLRTPNNTLAIEYLRANSRLDRPMNAMTVRRVGAGHDAETAIQGFASASHLRKLLAAGEFDAAARFFPENTVDLLRNAVEKGRFAPDWTPLEKTILWELGTRTPEEMRMIPDVTEGLENRFLDAVSTSFTLSDLLTQVKTRRYTHARLRRILWQMMLGSTAELQQSPPPYIRVLAMNERGTRLLKEMKKKASLPIYHSMAQLQQDYPLHAGIEKRATRLFSLCCTIPQPITEYPLIRPPVTDRVLSPRPFPHAQ